jgi:hypothetical protein
VSINDTGEVILNAVHSEVKVKNVKNGRMSVGRFSLVHSRIEYQRV